jgi:isoleucyl-tRNA synthetase
MVNKKDPNMADPTDSTQKKSFKDTLNLPRTDFSIRPNHVTDDAAMLVRWQRDNLYEKAFNANQGKEKFILHDGPPYANGNIHLGHAYNKILKDIITKSRRMAGMHVPVIPGWDCHGLPIEIKVAKEHPNLEPYALKKECRKYALKWVDIQRQEFKKLGVVMHWDKPYLTMDPNYEAAILRAFGIFFKQGYIEKKKKTVPWCMHCQTVLASAEIEYQEQKDPSIYVKFPLQKDTVKKLMPLADKEISLLIWTTTPWTLPLNRAVTLKPKTVYAVLDIGNNQAIIVAQQLAKKIADMLGIELNILFELSSELLQGVQVQHPLIDNFTVPVILDDSVSLSDGTACVHCAPGCGPEDYEIGLKNKLEIFSPISADGKYTKGIEPAELEGMLVTDGQFWVIKKLAESGMLAHKTSIKHSYPHCWRCRNKLIFRATNQWFCNLEKHNLKQKSLDAINDITFYPPRSANFLKATVEGRLEWCLSRQRIWGVPIPALLCAKCDYAFINQELIETVARGIETDGIEYWDTVTIKELGISISCPQCASIDFKKEQDILDVWFDSGVSHYAVLYNNPQQAFPADIYAEGLDQHRGWFQSSLLTSMVLEQESCTKAFLTHGFTVDEKGHKMSKSIGNVVAPDEIIAKLGTDGLRLWAASINYEGDAVVSKQLLDNVAEVYRKIRNTCRFLLSNLYDFDYAKDALAEQDLLLIDQLALEQLAQLNRAVRLQYEANDFTGIFHALADYCAKDLSSLYLDIVKDRLYVEQPNGRLRRSAQTVCWRILDTLTRLMAPILSITAELISDSYQQRKTESIHLQQFNIINPASGTEVWQLLLQIRQAVLKALESKRAEGIISHSLDARIVLSFALEDLQEKTLQKLYTLIESSGQHVSEFLKEFFIVSQIEIVRNPAGLEQSDLRGLYISVERAQGNKCPRCWQWDIATNADHLCNRCFKVLQK